MESISLTIDGQTVAVPRGTTILQAARKLGIEIPTLCYHQHETPVGVCRLCVVEVKGARTLVPACAREAEENMQVATDSERTRLSRRTNLELLLSAIDLSEAPELLRYASRYAAEATRFTDAEIKTFEIQDDNSCYLRHYSKCVLCRRCTEACGSEVQHDYAIIISGRGFQSRVSTFGERPMPETSCVFCGNCVAVCPTGAILDKRPFLLEQRLQEEVPAEVEGVPTTCPFCGVGCKIKLHVHKGRLVKVTSPPESAVNRGFLCVKGRFGCDYVEHQDRLTDPLIKKNGRLRKASWDEALKLVATRLGEIGERSGPDSIGGLASAKCTNEDNYLFQKFIRAVIGTNNVDHCARL